MFTQGLSLAYLMLFVIVFVYACHVIARKKGLDPIFWGVMGGIFGPLALIIVLLKKSVKSSNQ